MHPIRLSRFLPRPRSRIVWGRSHLFVAAGALLWGLSGCTLPEPGPGDPGAPQGHQVRTAFQVSESELDESFGVFVVLDKAPNAFDLFEGTLTMSRNGRAESAPVTATIQGGNELHVDAGEIGISLTWDELRIDLRDIDDDGVFESGSGYMFGTVNWLFNGPSFSADFEAAPDAFQVAASAFPQGYGGALVPWQPLVISLKQPVPEAYLDSLVVLADGEQVQGDVQVDEDRPYHTEVRFVPRAFYPLGSEVQVALEGMQNAVGMPVEIDGAPIPVMADEGPANANLGFEQEFAGWSTMGAPTVVGSYGGVVPPEGTVMAVLETGYTDESRLVGYLDVSEEASVLDLSLEVFTEVEGRLPSSITVRLYHEDLPTEPLILPIYEFGHETDTFVPCDCPDPGPTQRSGTFRREVSLAELRGERVFIEILIDGEPWDRFFARDAVQALGVLPIPPPPPPVWAALIIDDIQIR